MSRAKRRLTPPKRFSRRSPGSWDELYSVPFYETANLSQGLAQKSAAHSFLEGLNGGPLTFGQLLSAQRESEEVSVSRFAARLGVSRQHLHLLAKGQKRVSPERAVRFARLLGQSETLYLPLALQDLANASGLKARVEVRVA